VRIFEIMTEEVKVKPDLLKFAKFSTILVIVSTLGQASTGLARNSGYEVAASHAYAAQLGLVACVAIVALVIMSKSENKKLKGMSFGLATIWLIQYGLGEMFSGMAWISLIHAVVAMAIFGHALALMRVIAAEHAIHSE
jgi:asparagine N-glycosylation enzyme membrane subunit Stt3